MSLETCGAQEWYYDEDNSVVVNGTCELLKDHADEKCAQCGQPSPGARYHREMRDGRVWAEWSGDRNERAPTL